MFDSDMLPRESPVSVGSVGLKGVVFVKCDQFYTYKECCKFEINTLIPCVSLLLIITKLVTVEFFINGPSFL